MVTVGYEIPMALPKSFRAPNAFPLPCGQILSNPNV